VIAPPTNDSLRARFLRRLYPGLGWCSRCGMPWTRVEGHRTPYGYTEGDPLIDGFSYSRACFPLCEGCWARLTIAERIPYYESLVGWWTLGALDAGTYEPDSMNRDLESILAAVRAGL
jgi:hypothetical protein